MLIDLASLQWWQALTALVVGIPVALGLSPAPWLLGMARGSIQFTKTAEAAHDKLVNELKAYHATVIAGIVKHHAEELRLKDERIAELRAARDLLAASTMEERRRAEKATDQLAEAAEIGRLALHAFTELGEAAKDGAR